MMFARINVMTCSFHWNCSIILVVVTGYTAKMMRYDFNIYASIIRRVIHFRSAGTLLMLSWFKLIPGSMTQDKQKLRQMYSVCAVSVDTKVYAHVW